MTSPYILSVEPVDGKTFLHSFHLGTNLRVAKFEAEGIFARRKWFAGQGTIAIRTVALFCDGKMVDCFDGEWASDTFARLWDEGSELGVYRDPGARHGRAA